MLQFDILQSRTKLGPKIPIKSFIRPLAQLELCLQILQCFHEFVVAFEKVVFKKQYP